MICFASTILRDRSRANKQQTLERRQITTHHVYPQVRFGALRHFDWNKVSCTRGAHDLIHEVFANRTPGESVDLLLSYWELVQFHTGTYAIDFLRRIYWQELLTDSEDPECIWPKDWQKHLSKHERRAELIAIFRKIPPWKICRWVKRLDLLVNGRSGEEAIDYLVENFWNGFSSDEWAIYQWCIIRKPRKPRRVKHEHQEFHRPRLQLRIA